MPFDLIGYHKKHADYYGDAPLDEVARDAFKIGGYDKEFPDFETWKQVKGIDPVIQEDIKRRTPPTFMDKLRAGTSHVAPVLGDDSILGEIPKGLEAGVQQVKGFGYGLSALAGEATGSETLKKFGAEGIADVEKNTPKPQVASFTDIQSGSDLAKYLAYGISTNIPNMALSFASGGVGALLGKKAVASAAEAAVSKAVSEKILQAGITKGAVAGAGAASIGMEAGSIASDQLTETGEVSPGRAIAGAIPAGLLDVLPEYKLAKKLGWLGKDAAEFAGNRAVQALKVAAQQFLWEAPTEAMQSVIERAAVPGKSITNDDAKEEYINSFILGGLTGSVVGGGSHLVTGAVKGKRLDETDQLLDRLQKGASMSGIIYTGLKEGTVAGHRFSQDDAIEIIKAGQKTGIYDDTDVDRFKDQYPQLRDGLNGVIAEKVIEKVNQIVTETPAEPAPPQKEEAGRAPSPGQPLPSTEETDVPESVVSPLPETASPESVTNGRRIIAQVEYMQKESARLLAKGETPDTATLMEEGGKKFDEGQATPEKGGIVNEPLQTETAIESPQEQAQPAAQNAVEQPLVAAPESETKPEPGTKSKVKTVSGKGPGDKTYIDNKIRQLGTIEAVNAFYAGKDAVSDYARTMAPKILGVREKINNAVDGLRNRVDALSREEGRTPEEKAQLKSFRDEIDKAQFPGDEEQASISKINIQVEKIPDNQVDGIYQKIKELYEQGGEIDTSGYSPDAPLSIKRNIIKGFADANETDTGLMQEVFGDVSITALPANAETREPWEMTRERAVWGEFIPDGASTDRALSVRLERWEKIKREAKGVNIESVDQAITKEKARIERANAHRAAVETAISEGKPVPQAVLADYPDLTPAPVAAPAPAVSKQPWEMTRDEWLQGVRFYRSGKTKNAQVPGGERVILSKDSTASNFREKSKTFLHNVRMQAIAGAIKKGETIPADIRSEFPELDEKGNHKDVAKPAPKPTLLSKEPPGGFTEADKVPVPEVAWTKATIVPTRQGVVAVPEKQSEEKKPLVTGKDLKKIKDLTQRLVALGGEVKGYEDWIKAMESGDPAQLKEWPPVLDTIRALESSIDKAERIKAAGPAAPPPSGGDLTIEMLERAWKSGDARGEALTAVKGAIENLKRGDIEGAHLLAKQAQGFTGTDLGFGDSIKKTPAPFGSTNKMFTEDKAAKAREILRQKLGGIHMGAPLDPEVIQAGIDLAGYYIEGGARSFDAYARKMIADLGDVIRPYLKSFYMAVRNYPGFDKTDMDNEAAVDGIDENTIDITEGKPIIELKEGGVDRASVSDERTTKTEAVNGQGSGEGEGAGPVQTTEGVGEALGVREEQGKRDDGELPGGVREAPGQASEGNDGGREGAEPGRVQPVGEHTGDVPGIPGGNYRISEGELTRTGSWKDAAKTNLDVIELLKRLDEEKRAATPEEKSLLVKYTGWGSSELANNMFPGIAYSGTLYPNSAKEGWKPLVERLEALLSPEDIKTAAKSTQYAHYTSEAVIRAIYNGLERIGFKGGKVLEPGMGVGHFAGLMPWKSSYTGVEMDATTARIAKYLYPKHHIKQEDFSKTVLPDNFFDLSIGNPPFASTVILSDPAYKKRRFKLHEYFIAKSLDKTKPGGLMVFISSRYAMDKVESKARDYISEKADLLGAIRLPQTAFKQNAGTEVVTDVMFFRKRLDGEIPAGQLWKSLKEIQTAEGPVSISEYFADHPEMVLGKNSLTGSMYKDKEYTVLPAEGKIEDHFAEAVQKLPAGAYDASKLPVDTAKKAVIERDMNPTNKKEGGLYLSKDGKLMRVESGTGVALSDMKKLNPKDNAFLKDYVSLRDSLKKAQHDQLNEGAWEKSLKELNKTYNAFVKKHGNVQEHTVYEKTENDEDGNPVTVEYRRFKNAKLMMEDVENSLVWALEKIDDDGNIKKSAILEGRTIKAPTTPEIKTPADALAVSLDHRGKLDLDYVASLIGESKESVIEQLGDLLYEEPGKDYTLADDYLSGDVVTKLEEAKAAAATDKKYERNVKALEDVQPVPLAPENITLNLGANWIPIDYYNDFAQDVIEIKGLEVYYRQSDNSWTLGKQKEDQSSYYYRRSKRPVKRQSMRSSTSDWGTSDRGANEILESVLNNRTIKVMRTERLSGGETRTYLDPAATAAVNDVAKKMREAFQGWVWQDAERANDLLTIYNRRFNNIAGRKLDGRHLTLPGFTSTFQPHDHQKRAIWRIIQTGNTYLAHAVGAGKTMEMIAAGMEMKRLGMISKPVYVVPKHMLQQFANEFQLFYPMAHVMIADEVNFHTENRRRFIAQAALNNPDAIVITHPSLSKLKMKAENIAPVRDAYLQDMRDTLEELEEDKQENRIRIKQMEKRIEQAEQRFDAMVSGQGKDSAVSFEEMGADFVFVDEAHNFRKLDFVTNRQAKGIDPIGSVKAMDLYIKTLYLEKKNPGRSHVFASGTPVVNTMGELYTIMKFFSEKQMDEEGMHHFDAWANMFGVVTPDYEMNAAGRYELVERFSKFVNIPELMSRVREFTDVLTMSQLGKYVVRPDIKGGRPQIVIAQASPALKSYQENVLMPRIKESRAWKPSKDEPGNPDPLINIITDGRLASIDLRYVTNAANDPNSKLNTFIDGIIKTYQETKDHEYLDKETGKADPVKGGTQIVFYNLGFGEQVAKNRGFDARAWVSKRLKDAGIPSHYVAWIDDYGTAVQKEAIFKEMRQGKKRILIGSAKKMGTGVNVQKRLVDLHYLDAPWYPADVEQPDGRILRQGNLNKEVGLYRYATKGSYDATMWQMVARKSKMNEQAWAGDKNVRSLEDVSEASQYAMASAMASGDERVIQLVGLQADITRLGRLKEAHGQQQMTLQYEKRQIESAEGYIKKTIAELEEAHKLVPDYIRDIEGKIGGETFDNRVEFGEKILEAVKEYNFTFNAKSNERPPVKKIATLNGHTVTVTSVFGDKHVFINATEKVHESFPIHEGETDPRGLVTKMVNFLNGIERSISDNEEKIESNKRELQAIAKRIGAPFEYANELAEKIAEEARLKSELAAEGAEPTAEQLEEAKTAKPPEEELASLRKQARLKWEDFHKGEVEYPLWATGVARAKAILAGQGEGDIEDAQDLLDEAKREWEVDNEDEPYPPEFATVQKIITSIRQGQGKLFKGDQYSATPDQTAASFFLLQDVQSIFKGQEVIQPGGPESPIYVKTRGGKYVTVETVNFISPDEVDFQFSYGEKFDPATMTITGAYGDGVIRLRRDKAGKWTAAHESYHALRAMGIIPDSDAEILKKHIQTLVRFGKRQTANKSDIGGEEDQANWMADVWTKAPPSGIVGKIIARVQEFLDRLMEAFGIRTAGAVTRDVTSGRIFEREATEAADNIDRYSFEKAPPKKTIVAYKLFRTLKGRPGELFPLFIGKNIPTPIGKWVSAEFLPTKGFSYRPGWHVGRAPQADHLMKKDGTLPPDRVWAEVEIPADVDWQEEANKQATKDIQGHVPEGGYYRFKRPANQGGEWLIAGSIKVNRVLSEREVEEIRSSRLPESGRREQYSVIKQSEPPQSKDPKVLNLYLKDETDAIVQTIINKLHPESMSWLETMLKSPEWFDHPQVKNIVRFFMRDRSEIYHETFNDLNKADNPFQEYDTVTEAAKALKNKGLTMAERWAGKVSLEYERLGAILDEGDTTWQRDTKVPLKAQLKKFEDHIRKQGATEDTIAVWKLYRDSYDKALDLQTKQLRDMIDQVTEEAHWKGETPDLEKLKQTLKGALAQMEEWKGFYAPRVREQGDWKVQAYRTHGPMSVNKEFYREHAGSELAARRLANKLQREGWTISNVGKVEKVPEEVYQDVNAVATAKLIDVALDKMGDKGDLSGDLTAKFNEEILRAVADEIRARGFRGHMIHRTAGSTIRGFIEDPLKRHLLYINQLSGGISKARVARMAMEELLGQKVMGQQEGGIDPVKDPKAYEVATNYIREQLRNMDSSDRMIGLAKSIATFKFLGFSVRSLAVNMTAVMTTAPAAIHQYVMGGKGSMMGILREIGIAGKDYGALMAGKKLSNSDEQRFMDDAHKKGWDDAQYTREALGEISKVHSKIWSTVMDGSMYLFGKSEKWNRGATLLAAYRVARKRGLDHISAMEKAKNASDKAHGVYGRSTMPMWAQGTNPAAKLGQMMYVYSKFGHNYLQMLYDMGLKKHNIKGAMFAFLSPLVIAGGAALPFKDAIFGFAGVILKAFFGDDRDPEKWVWDTIREHLGKKAEKIGRHGLTGAAGLDISGSLSIGVGIPKNFIDLTGAIGGVATEGKEAWDSLMEGRPGKAAEHLLPAGFANPLRALREEKEGATTRKNRRVWDENGKPFIPSGGETAARAFGFRSTNQAVLSERTFEGHEQQSAFAAKRNAIYERFRAWEISGRDRQEYQRIIKAVQEYNASTKGVKGVSRITSQSLRDQARRMRRPSKNERALLSD